MDIKAQISIAAQYDDKIFISVRDTSSNTTFLEMTLSREQLINASMNRLHNTNVQEATVNHLDRVGKKMEMGTIHFEAPIDADAAWARDNVALYVPEGWIPDMGFGTQGSFYTKNGVHYAQTTIRRWV